MQVQLVLKEWKITKSDKKGDSAPVIAGEYAIEMDGKEIAKQDFNGCGFGSSKKIPFSGDLVQKVMALEKAIADEIKTLV